MYDAASVSLIIKLGYGVNNFFVINLDIIFLDDLFLMLSLGLRLINIFQCILKITFLKIGWGCHRLYLETL